MTNDYSKVLTLSTGESIFIYDNFFPSNEQLYFENFAKNSNYRRIFIYEERPEYFFWGSMFDEEDINNIRFLERDSCKKISKFFVNKTIARFWILATTNSTKYEYHTDWYDNENYFTITYYLNSLWDKNWGGETLFCNNHGETETAVEYKPNRLIIFPSKLLHKPSLHSYWGVRYSLSIIISPDSRDFLKESRR